MISWRYIQPAVLAGYSRHIGYDLRRHANNEFFRCASQAVLIEEIEKLFHTSDDRCPSHPRSRVTACRARLT